MSYDKHEIRESSPVDAIIGKPPSSIVRWGITIIAFVVLIAFLASLYIEFPYTVPGKVVISTSNPPASLMAQTSGNIEEFWVNEGQQVEKGEMLALIESSADIESVNWLFNFISGRSSSSGLDSEIESSLIFPADLDLGELQSQYSLYKSAYMDYLNLIDVDQYGRKIAAVNSEIESINKYILQLKKKEELSKEKVGLARLEHDRNLELQKDTTISQQAFEDSQESYLNVQIELENVGGDIAESQIRLHSKEQELVDYEASSESEERRYLSELEQARLKLSGDLEDWFQNHVLISNISGKVTFTKYWGENQPVIQGEIVMIVIPEGKNKIVGKVNLSMRGSGRVDTNQKVIIKLDAYPYIEYGTIEARVNKVNLIAQEDSYIVDLSFPDDLITSKGDTLNFSQNMSGNALIITNNFTLIERIVDPIRYFIDRNKNFSEN